MLGGRKFQGGWAKIFFGFSPQMYQQNSFFLISPFWGFLCPLVYGGGGLELEAPPRVVLRWGPELVQSLRPKFEGSAPH